MKKTLIILTALMFTATTSYAGSISSWATNTANKINQAEASAAKSIQDKKDAYKKQQEAQKAAQAKKEAEFKKQQEAQKAALEKKKQELNKQYEAQKAEQAKKQEEKEKQKQEFQQKIENKKNAWKELISQ